MARRPLLFVLLFGALVFLPAVRSPYVLDDFLHIAMIEGNFPGGRSPFDLYNFVDDGNRATLLRRGLLPWWTQPELKIRFFRPLGSAITWGEHRLLGHHPLPMHVLSLGWWVLAVFGVHALLRRTFSARVSLLGAAVFALAPCHALPLAWLANRETLVCLAFGTFALAAYARWRQGGAIRDAALATTLFSLALLGGGEYALGFGGYILAIEVVRRKDGVLQRAKGLAPFALPTLSYLAVRANLGYGTAGSGFYTDPLRDPVTFLGKVPWRVTALLAEGWLTYDVSAWTVTSPRWVVGVFVGAAAIGLAWPIRRTIAALETEPRAMATWMLFGSVLSLAPMIAVVPAMRLLGVSVVGIALVVALVLDRAWFADAAAPPSRTVELTSLAALALGFAHLVHGPGTAWLAARRHQADANEFVARTDWLRERAKSPSLRPIGVVRAGPGIFFAPYALDTGGAPPPQWVALANAGHILVERIDARTFEIFAAADKGLYPIGDGNLYRAESAPLRVGAVTVVPGVQATVLQSGPLGPRAVRLVLDRDASDFLWFEDKYAGYREAVLPAIGFGAPFDP